MASVDDVVTPSISNEAPELLRRAEAALTRIAGSLAIAAEDDVGVDRRAVRRAVRELAKVHVLVNVARGGR